MAAESLLIMKLMEPQPNTTSEPPTMGPATPTQTSGRGTEAQGNSDALDSRVSLYDRLVKAAQHKDSVSEQSEPQEKQGPQNT